MRFSRDQRHPSWTRWGRGEPNRLIARSPGCHATEVGRVLVRLRWPTPTSRRRRDRHLSSREREEIFRGIAAGPTTRAIAVGMGRSASTVSPEIARNGGRSAYRAWDADAAAWQRARRPPRPLGWPPIRCCLARCRPGSARTGPRNRSRFGSAVDARTARGAESSTRRSTAPCSTPPARAGSTGVAAPALWPPGPPPPHRPPQRPGPRTAEDHDSHPRPTLRRRGPCRGRALGGDLVMGERPSAVATLVERRTRYLRVVALPDGYEADAG